MNKNKVVQGKEFENKIRIGINTIADVIKTTLGPKGKTVIFKNDFGDTVITQDGASIAKKIELKDYTEAMAANLIKTVSTSSEDKAGDGTTTATVIAQALFNGVYKHKKDGIDINQFKTGMQTALEDIVKDLEHNSYRIDVKDNDLFNIIKVSCHSENISELISKIYSTFGKSVIISAERTEATTTTVETFKGMSYNQGYLSPYAITEEETKKVVFENPYILFYEGKLKSLDNLSNLINSTSIKNDIPIIIMAESIEPPVVEFLYRNYKDKILVSCPIKSPNFGENNKKILKDMAIFTGGKVITQHTIDYEESMLGRARIFEVDDTRFTILEGKGETASIQKRVITINTEIEKENDFYEKKVLEERLARITSGAANIKVGGRSEVEIKEHYDKIVDAKFAAKAALEDGVVEGGGMALFNTSNKLKTTQHLTSEISKGYNTVLEAIRSPFNQILINADLDPETIEEGFTNYNKAYDITEGRYVDDLKDIGIVDPLKVTIVALENAFSVINTLLNVNSIIIPDN